MHGRHLYQIAFALLATAALSGCAGAVVGAGATAGVAVAQERSVGSAIDDTGIQLEINRRFLEKSDSLFTDVDLSVVEGRVLMTGDVSLPDHRIEAARLAWSVNGVREVLNELQVDDRSSILSLAKDAWVTTQLRVRMAGDTDILDINYTVETVNGVVYLIGIAQDATELERVTNHARTIANVKKVVSHVQLKSDRRRTTS